MPSILGHVCCPECGSPVIDAIADKTGGFCPRHFREQVAPIIGEVIANTADGRRLPVRIVRARRTRADRASRARAKKRPDVRERRRLTDRAERRAKQRLTKMLPGVYELLLAFEREDLGLEGWTIERALTPHLAAPELDMLLRVHGIDLSTFLVSETYDSADSTNVD